MSFSIYGSNWLFKGVFTLGMIAPHVPLTFFHISNILPWTSKYVYVRSPIM